MPAERRAGGIKDMEQVALTPRVEHKQPAVGVAPDRALVGIYFQVSFRLRHHCFGQQLTKQVITSGFSRRQRGFPDLRFEGL